MHGGGRQQRRNGDAVRPHLTIGEHDDVVAALDRRLGTFAEPIEHFDHALGAARDVIGEVQRLGVETVFRMADGADLFEIAIGQDRLAHF